MKVLDLFSGIGGFSIGLEKVGFETVAFCEIEPYCQAVIRKHWPDTPIYNDVRSVNADRLAADGHDGIDVITAGFPCQDISIAGHGAGLDGERSGLWSEVARIVGEIRPRWVMLENVAALLGRGMGRVIGDLAAIGYDAQWEVISASAVGAPHRRQRVWIVAHDRRKRSTTFAPSRYLGSKHFRGAMMSEGLRTSLTDPIYTHPNFAEAAMGYAKDYTLLETVSSRKSPK